MVEFNKNEYGVWEEHGSLPPGCHLVNLQYLVAGSWEPPIGSMAALRPARVRELMNDPIGPKPKESYRMIPITVIPKEIDMSKAKKTKAPKVTKAGRERGLAAVAKEKAAAKTPIAAKPATSDTSKVKGAEAQDAATPAHDVGRGRAAKSKATRKAKRSKKAATEGHGPREGSKTAIILDLIRRPKGATLEELMAAAGWQAHSVRGMLSAVVTKKMGLKLQSTKREDGHRVYQLES